MRIDHWFYMLPLRLRSLFSRRSVEQDLDDELQYHLAQRTEEFIAKGMSPDDARYAALREMDGLTQRKEECRDARGVNFIDNTLRDVRYAWRILKKSPGFALVAILTLTLAIGANAVVFGILNGLILRPLNAPHAENLYGTEYGDDSGWGSYPNYLDLRDRNRCFESLAAWEFVFAGLDTGNDPVRSTGYSVTGNYFDVLGVQPYLGRLFHAADERGYGSAPYLVLTYAYWHAHFQDDRNVVGRTVRLNKHPFTIIGVAPEDFRGTLLFGSPDFFIPIVNLDQVNGGAELNARGSNRGIFQALGHLKPGVTLAQAITDVNSVGAWLRKMYPRETGRNQASLSHPGLSGLTQPVQAFVAALMLLAGLILLAACANLGGLFAAHASDRSREIALRLALGSSRRRILQGLFVEATLISLAGGAAGLLLSVALLRRLSVWQPFPGTGLYIPVTPDTRVYLIALALALVSGLLFGIVPVRQVLRTDPYQIVKAGSAGRVGRRITVRDLLLAAQIAICALLVTASMVAVRGLVRSLYGRVGFEPRNVMLAGVNLAMGGYSGESVPAMQKRMIDAMETIPGVERVGLVNNYPPLGYAAGSRINIFKDETRDLNPSNAAAMPYHYEVSDGYFGAAETRLLAGRDFTPHDNANAPLVAVANRAFAARMFGSMAGAIGGYCRMQDGNRVQIVGVVEDGKYLSLTEDQQPAIFLPFLQSPMSQVWLVVRSSRDPQQLAAAIRNRIHVLDAGLPVDTQTWNTMLNVVMFPARVATVALGVLGTMGAILSITGIFGMAAYSVSRRLKELGIRVALGAQRTEVLRAALGRAFKLLALGSAAGLALGILASQVLASIVYQATPRDPLVLIGVVLSMAVVGLLATWIPAHRAMSLDPLSLLREE